jgi:hypothetical protein
VATVVVMSSIATPIVSPASADVHATETRREPKIAAEQAPTA